ncbi:MAG: hypothetical protein ACYTGW_03810 [Planctomycetota bacterium]
MSVFVTTGRTVSDFKTVKKNTTVKSLYVNAQTTGAQATTCATVTQTGQGMPGGGTGMCSGMHGGGMQGGGMHGGGMHGGGMQGGGMQGGGMQGGGMQGGGMQGGGMHSGTMHGGTMHGGTMHGGTMHVACMGQTSVYIMEMGSSSARGNSAGTSSSTSKATATQGPHSFQFSAAARNNTKGTLRISWMGHASGGAAVSVAIDVNGDNKPDFTATQKDMMLSKSLNVVAGSRGFVFMITTNGNAAGMMMMGQSSYSGCLNLCLETSGGHGHYGGMGCGPMLSGNMVSKGTAHVIDLNLRRAAPNAFGAMVVGTRRIDTPIPGTNCLLYTNLYTHVVFQTDSMGMARHRFSFTLPTRPSGFVQDVIISQGGGGTDIKTSNLLHLQ